MNSDPHFFHNMIMLYLALGKHQVKFLRLNIIWIRHYGILLYCRTYLKKYIQFNIFLVPWVLCYAKSLQLCPALYKPMDCIACQAPLSMGFPRQEYWSGLPCSPPGDLPDPGIEPGSPALQADSLLSEPPDPTQSGSGHFSVGWLLPSQKEVCFGWSQTIRVTPWIPNLHRGLPRWH